MWGDRRSIKKCKSVLTPNLDFTRKAKISDLQKFVVGNENITTGEITMDNVQTGQVLLYR